MKSIGISTSQVIQEISPNIYEVSKSGVDLSRNMITSMKRNNTSINRVSDQLRSNKYVRFAQTAYKNALTDIKSGNLNNTGRYMDDMNDSIEGLENLGEGISFGDDGSDNVNVNVINQSGSNEAMLKMSDQLQKNAVGQAKMQKASMDAYIAVSAANMQQMNQLGGEIVNQLTNVNSNLSALVAYNNQNVTKFIEASLAYYDKAGSSGAANSSSSYTDKGKISAKDVLNSSSGGINMGQYKNYVKQQFKDMVDKSDVGLIKSILSDDSVLEMAASNPLGFMTTSLTRYMMPKILKTSLESMETTFTNFMPTILSQLADMASTEGNDFMSKFKRTFGQVFGLKTERIEKMQRSSVNREAIPFDGETKHAITEIITKELREQTGYLQIIASHYNKNAKAVMQRNQEYYSYRTNGYVKQDQINTDIANEIVDSIQTAFSSTKFGEAMMRIPNAIKGDSKKANAIRGEYNNTVREIFAAIEKSNKTVDLPFLIELINNTGADKTTKKDIIEYVKKLHEQDIDSFQSINVGRLSAQGAANEAKKRIQNDSTAYHLNDSKFVEKDKDGNIRNIDDVINEVLNWGAGAKGRQKTNKIDIRSNLSGQTTSQSSNKMNFSSNDLKVGVKGSIKNASDHATGIMRSLMNGDTKGVLEQGASFMTNQLSIITDMSKKFFLGDKDEAGKFKGGFLSSIANDTKAKFQKIGDDVKNGVMLKLFGKVKDKETGQYIKDEDSKGGLFGQVAGVFKKGLDGWTDALFGSNDDNREATQKSIVSKLKESAPNAAVGAALGAGVGIMSGGSLLGMLVGGPIAGAGMGAAVGLLSKNESFQNWLFGAKDKDTGERSGGLISKKTQDFFKDNKSFMMGSAALGAVSGAITGGGFLGTLVGGPIAGAMIGMAGGIIKKSGVFDRFLFGDEKNGQKGLIKGVQDAWKSHFKNSDDKDLASSGAKAIGMTGLGTAAGGLIGAMVGGPVLGALAGFGLSVKAQSGNFKEWLFGKEDGLSLGNGKKVKKQGVIGIIGNTIDVNIIKPMKTQFKYMADDAMNVLEHKILAPFAFAAEFVADKAGAVVGKITSGAESAFKKVTGTVGKAIGKAFDPFTRAIGKTMTKATDAAYKTIKTVASAPGAFITATIKTLKLKERFDNFLPVKAGKAFVKDVRNLIIKGIKGLFKGVFNVITAPFRGAWKLTKKVGSGIKSLGKKIGGIKIGDKSIGDRLQGVKNKFNGTEWAQNFKEAMANSGTFGTLSERMKLNAADYKKRKEEIENQKKENKRHAKNAQIIKRLTGGQFAEDSEEARTWLRFNKPDALGKLNGTSITEEAEIAKNGKSTAGMSENNLESANLSDLNEEGKQTKLLYNIWTWLTGKFKKKDEEVPDEEKDKRKEDKEELKGKAFNELAAEARERGIDFDDSTSEDELRQKLANDRTGERGYNPKAPSKLDQKRWSLKSMWKNTKNYFKNEFFSNTRKVVQDRKNQKSQTEEAVDQASAASGENVEKNSIGGILKKGLHLIGEKGAELLNLDDDGAEVLSSDDTEDAAKQVKNKQNKRKKKLADFFKKRKKRDEEEQAANLQEAVSAGTDNALEEQSDESLRNRLQSASYMVGAARNKEEKRNANIEQNRAIMAKREDMRSDSQEKALKNAKTADELRKEVEEQKYRDQQLKNQAATINAIKDTGNATKSFKDLWSGIFGKKGLITAAALLGYAWLKKHLPKLMSALEGLLGGAASVAGNTLSDLLKDFKWGQKNKSRTDGNTAEEQLEKNVKDIKDGNILTDSEGNATHQTEARTKLLARLGLNFINSGVKTPGAKLPGVLGKSARMANRQKSVFNVAKNVGSHISNSAKNLGNKIFGKSTYEKATGKLVGSGMQFANDGSRMISSTDFARLTDGMGDTERALYQAQEGFQVLDDTEGVGRKLISKAKGTKVGQKLSGAKSKVGDILSGAKTKVAGKADDMAEALAAKAKANDGVLSSVSGYLEKFFNFIKDKFAKKTGSEISESALKFSPGSILKALKSKWGSICEKLAAKLAEVTGVKVSAAAVSFGISEAVFATIGALNGVSGTAKLFQVDSDKVDGTMRLIAGIFGALTGTTLGSIIDVILSFAGDIMNVDILHSLAVGMYKTIVGNDSKAAKNIDKYQDAWHDKYSKDQDKSIKEQYETQKKAGIIGKDVSYKDFKAGVKSGKYEASYTSFQDWNTKKNASLGDKITSGIGKGFKTAKNGLGKLIFGSTSYTDKKGNTYKKNSDGTYQVTSKDGKDLGYVSAKSIDTSKMKKNKKGGLATKVKGAAKVAWDNSGVGTLVNFATGIKEKGVKKAAKDALKKTAIVKAGTWLFKKPKGKCFYATDGSYYLKDGTHYSANGDKMDSITSDDLESKISSGELKEGTYAKKSNFEKGIAKAHSVLTSAWDNVSSFASKKWNTLKTNSMKLAKTVTTGVKNFFTKETEVCYYDTDGSYYLADGTHYSANDDKLNDDISLTELSERIHSGELKEGEHTTRESGFKKTVSGAKKMLNTAWTNVSGFCVDTWNNLKDKASKVKDKLVTAGKNAATATRNFLLSHTEKAWYDKDGSYYVSNGKGYTHYSATGDVISDGISVEDFEAIEKTGNLHEGTAKVDSGLHTKLTAFNKSVHEGWGIFTSHLSSFWDKTKSTVDENATKLAGFVSKEAGRVGAFLLGKKEKAFYNPKDGSYYKATGKGYTHYSANGDVIEENVDEKKVQAAIAAGALKEGTVRAEAGWKTTLKEAGTRLDETMKKGATALLDGWNTLKSSAGKLMTDIKEAGGVEAYIGGLFKTTKTKGWFDTNGSYYVLQGDGTYKYFNANGDTLKTKIPASEVEELKSLGLVTEHTIKKDSAAKKAINSIQDAVKDAWDTAKSTVTSAWSSFKSFITGKGGTGGGFGYSRKAQGGNGRGRLSTKRVLGGFGPDELNGASYFSQNDDRWRNASYNIGADQATMGDSGCGPTAMAMAINTARKGGNVTPMEMANIAKVTGNRDETGTNANFIGQSAAMMGMRSEERMNPSASDISAQLSTGNPVVMLGRNTGSGNNPYTMSGHYVVAVGQKPNGDVIVNDPRGKAYSKAYNINNLANATGSSWTVGNNTNVGDSGIRGRIGGLGRKLVNKIKGGFGSARDKWVGIVQATKKAIAAQKPGYNQEGWINVTVGGKTVSTRQDCSGMVTTAAKFFGAVDDSVQMWTGVMLDSSSPLNSKGCFQLMQFPGWESLAIGDILVNGSHTEVFAGLKDGQHYVYNCGSTSSVNNPGATISGHSSYDVIWRPVKPGPNCVSNVSVDYSGGFTGADGVGTSTDASVGGATSNESKLSQLTSYIGNFMTEFGSRVLTGDTSNTDYSAVLSGVMNSGSSDSSSSGVADDGSAVAFGNQTAMKGQTVTLPSGLGTQNSYMGWQCITAPDSTQYKLRQQAGQNFDSNGYGKINGRYTIATTTTYGNVGDYLDVKRSDGSVLKAVIADIKNQNDSGCNKWGHNNGNCVVEFVVDKGSWYQSDGNGGQVGYSRINQTDPGRNKNSVVSITNQGSYFSGGAGKGRPVKGGSGLMSRYTNDGRYGSTLSRRNRYRVDHAKKVAIGGFGASVNTASGFGSTMADKTGYANVYIKTTKDNSTQELLANAIEILALIANNTLNTSTRLAAMSKLNQLTGKNNQSNNVIITGNNSSNGNTAATSQPVATTKNTGEATARAIARGGY